MEYIYTAQTDDLYIRVSSVPVARTVAVTERCLVDVDSAGGAVGIEVLQKAAGWPIDQVVERFGLQDMEELLRDLAAVSMESASPAPLTKGQTIQYA